MCGCIRRVLQVDNGLSPVYYPNPVDGKLNISVGNTDAQSVLLKIYNLDGTLIRTSIQSVNSQTVTLDNLDGLASGMYMVVFELNNKYYSVKFIKSQGLPFSFSIGEHQD